MDPFLVLRKYRMAWNGRSRGISPGGFRGNDVESTFAVFFYRSIPPPLVLCALAKKKQAFVCRRRPSGPVPATHEGYAIFGLKGRKRKREKGKKPISLFSFGFCACLTLQHVCGCFCRAEQDMRAKVVPGLPKVSPPLPSSPTKLPAMLILDEGARTKHLFLACIEGEVLAEISPDTLFALWRRGPSSSSSPNLE